MKTFLFSLRWSGAAVATLAFVFTGAVRAASAPLTFSGIGAKATADYQGEALAVIATSEGARLTCAFQKLEGCATSEGLWLQSTVPGGGKFHLVARAVGREQSSARSDMCIVTIPPSGQAPSGAARADWMPNWWDMPLLTELETSPLDLPCYKHAAPDGAAGCLEERAQMLPRKGTVSVEDKVVRFRRPGVTEEYSVSVDGVRQDFLIAERPAGAGDLRMELSLSGARAEAATYGAKLTLDSSGRALAYSRLRAADANGQELRTRLEVVSPTRLAVRLADSDAIYPVRIDPTFSDANWVSLNPNMTEADGAVYAIAVDEGGNVYVGGDFTIIGNVIANCVAQWNGSAWSALGAGMSGGLYFTTNVRALAVCGTNLYAGGDFTTANGATANYIAAWDGSDWSALGAGLDGPVWALAVSGSNIYVGGEFSTAGEAPASGVAKWNGSAWSPLGSGMSGGEGVYALVVSGGTLYAGVDFSRAGQVEVNCIAKWNGNHWSALGSGVSIPAGPPVGNFPFISALAVSGSTLYVGGNFDAPGRNIAKWNGSTWSAVTMLENRVYSLAASGSTLFVGTDGGMHAYQIPNGNGRPLSGLGVNGLVGALAADNSGHLFVGGNFTFAGTNLSPMIAQANIACTISVYASPSAGGTVSGGGTSAVGSSRTVTARAKNGYIFSNWVGGTTPPYTVLSTTSSYTFTAESNLVLQANFVPNPFFQAQGTFNGLFLDTNDVTQANSGFFTLTLTRSGAFTGKVMTSGGTYTLPTTRAFDAGGRVQFTVPTKQNALTFNLQLDLGVPVGEQITGTVSDGTSAAALSADRAGFNATTNPAVNYEGRYTLAIDGSDEAATGPGGIGCATLLINPAGLISMTGNLADGGAVRQIVSVSKDGRWPFYAAYALPQSSQRGEVFSWISFSNQPATALGGMVYWFRPTGTNLALPLVGSAYNPAAQPLLAMTNGQVILEGGGLPFTITNQIALTSSNTIALTAAPENTNKLALTITQSSGAVGGRFADPSNPRQTIKVRGVLLQNQTNAAGYFLRTNQSGAFLLQNP